MHGVNEAIFFCRNSLQQLISMETASTVDPLSSSTNSSEEKSSREMGLIIKSTWEDSDETCAVFQRVDQMLYV